MSTRSTILDSSYIDIYEEHMERAYDIAGKLVGGNIYLAIPPDSLLGLTIKEGELNISISPSEFEKGRGIPNKMKFEMEDVICIDWDNDGLLIGVSGGTEMAAKIRGKEFEHLAPPL